MKNKLMSGKRLPFTAPAGGVVSGGLYKIGQLLVVAVHSAAAGQPFEAETEGVLTGVAKNTGQAWAEGALLYWDNTNTRFTTTASGNHPAACAAVAALSADATGTVRLNGTAAPNAA